MRQPIENPIIDVLKANPDITVHEIARRIGRETNDVAQALTRMDKLGLIARSGSRGWGIQKIRLTGNVRGQKKEKVKRNWFEGWNGAPKLGL